MQAIPIHGLDPADWGYMPKDRQCSFLAVSAVGVCCVAPNTGKCAFMFDDVACPIKALAKEKMRQEAIQNQQRMELLMYGQIVTKGGKHD